MPWHTSPLPVRALQTSPRPIISEAVPTIDLPADELAAVVAAIRRAIETNRFLRAPQAQGAGGGATLTVKVTNWCMADLVELQVAESGSAHWKKMLGALKTGQWTWAQVPQGKNCRVDLRGNTLTVSRPMYPMSISARTRRESNARRSSSGCWRDRRPRGRR
jgi:hypothetical protein